VDAALITIGDIVKLEQGDLVPADIRVLECSPNMCVDNSSLTGESDPIKRKPECTNADPLETANLCFFGTQVPEGSCVGVVVKIADNTVIGKIAQLALSTEAEQTPINKEIHHFIQIISAIAFALGISFFAAALGMGQDAVTSLVFMIGIIVANVPEGLLATVTVCLTLTAKRMYTKKVMVKNLEGVETLGSTSCICSDKTGTLTQNIMTVAQVVYDTNGTPKIQDAGSSFTKGISTYDNESAGFKALVKCSTLCNTCNFDKYFEDEVTGKRVLLPFSKVRVQGDGSTITEILWKTRGNASEGAMIKFAQGGPIQACFGKRDVDEMRRDYGKVFDIPFNSKNKYQVHVHCESQDPESDNNDRSIYMKGAPERIIDRCTQYMTGDGKVVEFTAALRSEVEKAQMAMGNNGLRVLGFCTKTLPIKQYGKAYPWSDGRDLGKSTANFPLGEAKAIASYKSGMVDDKGKPLDPPHPKSGEGLIFLGLMALVDPPREAVPGAVAKCKTAGIKVIMVTGDHPGTAEAIAYKVGILWSPTARKIEEMNAAEGLQPGDVGYQDPALAQAIVVPGWEISDDDPVEKWDAILEHPQIVFARTSPQQKLVIVGNCQRVGHVVAVTGDGVNDSPALKKADIGVAMGIAGTPVTKNAADMILLDDNFASIVAGVEEGRLIFDNLKKSICYTLTSNIPEISPFLCWIVFLTPMPLSTVLILAIDLGTDMVPAISMAYEDAEADIMKRPPRNAATDHLVTGKLMCLAYLQIGIMQALAGFYAWMLVLNDYGFPPVVLVGNPGATAPTGKLGFFADQVMYCKYNGGQYVNAQGQVDPEDRDPSEVGPRRQYPLWDRGDAGYLESCSFAAKNFNGRRSVPGFTRDSSKEDMWGSELPERKIGDGHDPTLHFDYTNADTYSRDTGGQPLPTIESIYAMHAQKYFEYVPWRGRMSEFWDSKWLAWDITRSEYKLAGGSKAGLLGYGNRLDNSKENLVAATFPFLGQPPGVWSVCLGEKGALEGKEEDSGLVKLQKMDQLYDNNNVAHIDLPTNADFAGCTGVTKRGTAYNKGTFCNGGYKLDASGNPVAKGEAGCSAFDGATANLFYCEGACDVNCPAVTPAQIAAGKGPNGGEIKQCQNVASRMVQKNALMHSQAAYWVSIVVVQWADLLICKTRWLSIKQQGLRNSVLNFGLFFETLLAAWLCYGGVFSVLGTQPIRFTHWMPGVPWSMMIFMYDETRKYMMRATSPEVVDAVTGAVQRQAGWIEKSTYY
jgi:sodium/potassium-transporting ATPase subunit alpha